MVYVIGTVFTAPIFLSKNILKLVPNTLTFVPDTIIIISEVLPYEKAKRFKPYKIPCRKK